MLCPILLYNIINININIVILEKNSLFQVAIFYFIPKQNMLKPDLYLTVYLTKIVSADSQTLHRQCS